MSSNTFSTNDAQELWVTVKVECVICTKVWIAVYAIGTGTKLECPHCGLINNPIILQL